VSAAEEAPLAAESVFWSVTAEAFCTWLVSWSAKTGVVNGRLNAIAANTETTKVLLHIFTPKHLLLKICIQSW